MVSVKHQMRENLDYIVNKVDLPIVKALCDLAKFIALVKRYPEPTLDNVLHPNSKRLVVIRDKFFLYERSWMRIPIYRALWKILIIKYESSPNYRHRLDWFLEMVAGSGWKSRPYGHPATNWREPGCQETLVKGEN